MHEKGAAVLSLPEEMLILVIHDQEGEYQRWSLRRSFQLVAAATLCDLAMHERVELAEGRCVLAPNTDLTRLPAIDDVLSEIFIGENHLNIYQWLERLANSNRFKNSLLMCLLDKGVIHHECRWLFGTLPYPAYPARDKNVGKILRSRLLAAIRENRIVDVRTFILMTLLAATPMACKVLPADHHLMTLRVEQWKRHGLHAKPVVTFLYPVAEAVTAIYAEGHRY